MNIHNKRIGTQDHQLLPSTQYKLHQNKHFTADYYFVEL
jgi:hypothetical protein